jgi:hypothetical protein
MRLYLSQRIQVAKRKISRSEVVMAENVVPEQDQHPLTLYTIGHSNHPFERFAELLAQYEIALLVDVRSQPYSRYATHFNRPELEYLIERRGIPYLYMGGELGGRPDGDIYYDRESHVLYDKVAEASFFLKGIERLIDECSIRRVAIMCSEEDPENCHRRLLIGRVLVDRNVELLHIRGDGRLVGDTNCRREAPAPTLWDGLFAGNGESQEWKSIQPVLRRKPQESSSSLFDDME